MSENHTMLVSSAGREDLSDNSDLNSNTIDERIRSERDQARQRAVIEAAQRRLDAAQSVMSIQQQSLMAFTAYYPYKYTLDFNCVLAQYFEILYTDLRESEAVLARLVPGPVVQRMPPYVLQQRMKHKLFPANSLNQTEKQFFQQLVVDLRQKYEAQVRNAPREATITPSQSPRWLSRFYHPEK